MKRCTVCRSTNVRRSSVRVAEASSHPFRSPYRCHDCDARFWVVSRRTRVGAAAGGAMALMIAVFFVVPLIDRQASLPAEAVPTSTSRLSKGVPGGPADRWRVDDILRLQSDALDQQLRAASQGETSR